MIDKIVEIEIFGQKYRNRVKGEEDEKYISHLTAHVDQKMREVAVKSKSVDNLKIAVLAALNIADELFLCQKKRDQFNEYIGHLENELESLEVHLRTDETKYKEIEENEFNLNIPRYVDTFEPEPEIDIKAVQDEIDEIEKELAKTRKKMNGYLKELGFLE